MEIDASNASHSSHAARAPQQLALPRDAPIPDGNFVALDVDGRKYRIRKSDLMSVPYFDALLGGNWAGIDLLPDGSLPIDTDPEIWPILFTYIKRPSTYPLLWTREKGFDYVGYNKLLSEAKFLGLEDLEQWILSKRYKEMSILSIVHGSIPPEVQGDNYGGTDKVQWRQKTLSLFLALKQTLLAKALINAQSDLISMPI
ncbi:hypothetical protein J4E85_002079 [Alternaria conjuncta]|nr:uncharacterized protein J4E85_002079 [Alternaria conjuncta]KAI4934223.1 hypothetical protein J4E85_002079 [Alternaria conjuncta]